MKNRQRQKDILFSILIFGSAFAVNLLIQKLFTTQTLVPMIFVVNADNFDAEDAVVETVRKYAKHYRIKSRNLAENSLDLVLELRTDEGGKLVREVMGLAGVTSASLLAHDGEVTF